MHGLGGAKRPPEWGRVPEFRVRIVCFCPCVKKKFGTRGSGTGLIGEDTLSNSCT